MLHIHGKELPDDQHTSVFNCYNILHVLYQAIKGMWGYCLEVGSYL